MSQPAGRRNRRITIQKLVEGAPSSSGGVALAPVDVATVWAEMVPERGTEVFREGQPQAWSTVLFRTLHFLDLAQVPTVKYQILYAGRIYDVLDVREQERPTDGWEFVSRARAEDRAA